MEQHQLAELVAIWEQWTQADPVLRQALQATERGARRNVLDQILERLDRWSEGARTGTAATTAAVYAAWAVLLALEGADGSRSEVWHRMHREAMAAHQEALAQRGQGR